MNIPRDSAVEKLLDGYGNFRGMVGTHLVDRMDWTATEVLSAAIWHDHQCSYSESPLEWVVYLVNYHWDRLVP